MRATNCSETLRNAGSAVGKVFALWSHGDGAIALVRTPDGQAYQVDVRPAALADFPPFDQYTKRPQRLKKLSALNRERKRGHAPTAITGATTKNER